MEGDSVSAVRHFAEVIASQDHACHLTFNTVTWWAFKSHDKYRVKQAPLRKLEQRKAQIPLGLSTSSYHTSLCFYPGTPYLPSSFSVALSYLSCLVRLDGSSKSAKLLINIFILFV